MRRLWKTSKLVISGSLFFCFLQVSASSIFSYAEINIPFEVRADSTWLQIIENREDWEEFYIENAEEYLGSDHELSIPPEFDFEIYTVIAGGLGAGSADRSLMIEYVRGQSSTTYIGAVVLHAGSGCNVVAAETYPTIVILIPKPQDSLQIFSRDAVSDCE